MLGQYVLDFLGCLDVNVNEPSLNSRDIKYGQGFNEEDSLTDHKPATNGRLPTSIRLNVVDAKAVSSFVPQGCFMLAERRVCVV